MCPIYLFLIFEISHTRPWFLKLMVRIFPLPLTDYFLDCLPSPWRNILVSEKWYKIRAHSEGNCTTESWQSMSMGVIQLKRFCDFLFFLLRWKDYEGAVCVLASIIQQLTFTRLPVNIDFIIILKILDNYNITSHFS